MPPPVSDRRNPSATKPTPEQCPPERLSELYEFRAHVWAEEGAAPGAFESGSWSDEADSTRIHWVVIDRGRIVGAASIGFYATLAEVEESHAYSAVPCPPPGLIAHPARVVVDAAYRGQGLATALLDEQDRAAAAAGAVIAVRQASPAMRRILERRGWRCHGPAPHDPRFPAVEFSVMSRMIGAAR